MSTPALNVQKIGPEHTVDTLSIMVKEQRQEIRYLQRQLRVYKQLDDDVDDVIYPPDHYYGYIIAFGAFLAQFVVLGSLNTYSLFNEAMTSDAEWGRPGYTKIALVNAVANFVSTLVGTFAGHASDVYGPRPLFLIASVLLFFGEYFGSHTSNYIEFALIYPLMVGTAAGFIISPGLGAVAGWFDKRRGLALGIAYAGSGAGSAIVPLAASYVYSYYGAATWRVTMRWMSVLAFPCILVGLFMRHRLKAKRFNTARRSVRQLLHSRPFLTLWLVGAFFGYGFFTAVYNIVPFAMAQGTGEYSEFDKIPVERATSLMTVFGTMQCIGNIVFGHASDAFGSTFLFAFSHVASGILMIAMSYVHDYWALACIVGAFGFVAAGCITCYPHVAAEFYTGPQLSSALALLYTGFGVGSLAGPPLTEVLITFKNGNFELGLLIAGLTFIIAAFSGTMFMPTSEEYKLTPLHPHPDDDDDEFGGTSINNNNYLGPTVHSALQ